MHRKAAEKWMLASARCAKVGGLKEESRTEMFRWEDWWGGDEDEGNGHRLCGTLGTSTVDSP